MPMLASETETVSCVLITCAIWICVSCSFVLRRTHLASRCLSVCKPRKSVPSWTRCRKRSRTPNALVSWSSSRPFYLSLRLKMLWKPPMLCPKVCSLVLLVCVVCSAQQQQQQTNEHTGELTQGLHDWLEQNLPKSKSKKGKEEKEKEKDKSKFELGVIDTKIGNSISESLGVKVVSNDVVQELLRSAPFVCLCAVCPL